MFEQIKKIIFRLTALNSALKNWQNTNQKPFMYMGDFDYLISDIQKTCFIGAGLPPLMEEIINASALQYAVPFSDDCEKFASNINIAITAIRETIAQVYPVLDPADKKLMGDIDYRLKNAICTINQEYADVD